MRGGVRGDVRLWRRCEGRCEGGVGARTLENIAKDLKNLI